MLRLRQVFFFGSDGITHLFTSILFYWNNFIKGTSIQVNFYWFYRYVAIFHNRIIEWMAGTWILDGNAGKTPLCLCAWLLRYLKVSTNIWVYIYYYCIIGVVLEHVNNISMLHLYECSQCHLSSDYCKTLSPPATFCWQTEIVCGVVSISSLVLVVLGKV